MDSQPRENVQDYPRPPRLERVGFSLTVRFGADPVAETKRGWRVLETHHAPTYYLPPEDIEPGLLRPASGSSFCEWKGRAAYFDVVTGADTALRAAWCYPEPTAAFDEIAGHLAFYVGTLSAWVGELPVRPQPGDFYGGWVTDNLDGIVKGGAGTAHW